MLLAAGGQIVSFQKWLLWVTKFCNVAALILQVYPGLMVTSGSIHWLLHFLNIPVHIRDICVFLAPIFSGMTALAVYLFTKEIWSAGAGLFAACFIAIGQYLYL